MIKLDNKLLQSEEKLNYGEFKEIYGHTPVGFRYYKDSILTYREWIDLMNVYMELKDEDRYEIIDAAKKDLAKETLYGVWSKY